MTTHSEHAYLIVRQLAFSQGGQLSTRFPYEGLGIPGTSGIARIRPAVLSGCRARLCGDVIDNGESPQDLARSTGALERGGASFGRHLIGGDRGMKATRPHGTSRGTTPFHHRGHTVRHAFRHADSAFAFEGVGVT